jgi:neutral ceramidase
MKILSFVVRSCGSACATVPFVFLGAAKPRLLHYGVNLKLLPEVSPMRLLLFVPLLFLALPASAQFKAGVATVSITPLEEGIPTQLGGYGDRMGEPAHGIHDTINAKVLILEQGNQKGVLVTMDVCSVPSGVVEEALEKSGVPGLGIDNALFAASHSHGGLEGFSLDRRNVIGNPSIGVFSEAVLDFTVKRIAQGIQRAQAALQPVQAVSAVKKMNGMNRNRRGAPFVDEDLTLLRLDTKNGKPYVLLVNYTAHGTIMTEKEMLISAGWAGVMQRTVEEVVGENVTCMYTNGAEGDMSPSGAHGGSRWEMAENYGRRIGLEAAELATGLQAKAVERFGLVSKWVSLPAHQGAPDFLKIAGDEYNVTQEQLDRMLPILFPAKAPIYGLRVNDFQMMTFPGEAICEIGLNVKAAMKKDKVNTPCIAGLTSELIGYILTKEEYAKSGYEVTASFYGDGLGALMQREVIALSKELSTP